MRKFLFRRLLLMIPLILGISVLFFSIMKLAPGDPATLSVNLNAKIDPGYITKLREAYGLNDPVWLQYWHWLKKILILNFGESFKDNRPVIQVIVERLPATMLLSGLAEILLLIIAVSLGVASAYYQGSLLDRFATIISFVGFAMPSLWLALMLMLVFGVQLGWCPVSGMFSVGSDYLPWYARAWDLFLHLILPVFVTTFAGLAWLSRFARTSMLDVIRQDYIRTARAKGLTEFQVVFKHALPNALIPIVTVIGLSLPGLIAGAVIIETIFGWPGMGRLSYEALMSRNYPVVMGIGVISAFLTILGNLLADIGYAILDPRIRYD
jgi:peptide/nickel transport system permease protein